MRKLILCIVLMISTGCADRKNLLNLIFPSSMMIDYQDGMYQIALQIDNLNSITKSELESSDDSANLLIATGKGKTIEDALISIEENERSVVNLSHVKSIILTKNTLSDDIIDNICHFASYNQELRCDSEIYYTENNAKELFSTSYQLSRSQLYILINSSEFQNIGLSLTTSNMMQLIKAQKEDYITVSIPVLNVTDAKDTYITQDGDKEQKVYEMNEILFYDSKHQSTIPLKDLKGMQWVNSHHRNVEVNIVENNDELSAYASQVRAYIIYHPQKKTYHLKGNVSFVINRDTANRDLKELETILKEKVHEQVMHTYTTGIENDCDIYNSYYKSLIFNQSTPLTSSNFKNELDIDVHIKGSYVGSN